MCVCVCVCVCESVCLCLAPRVRLCLAPMLTRLLCLLTPPASLQAAPGAVSAPDAGAFDQEPAPRRRASPAPDHRGLAAGPCRRSCGGPQTSPGAGAGQTISGTQAPRLRSPACRRSCLQATPCARRPQTPSCSAWTTWHAGRARSWLARSRAAHRASVWHASMTSMTRHSDQSTASSPRQVGLRAAVPSTRATSVLTTVTWLQAPASLSPLTRPGCPRASASLSLAAIVSTGNSGTVTPVQRRWAAQGETSSHSSAPL